MTYEQAQRLAREKGVWRPLYALTRALMTPFMRLWFGLTFDGAERIPRAGPVIIAPNHKSFWDSFFIALATRRHVRFMGKIELFTGPKGRLLVGLGAFPVRRGTSDAEALETARIVLRQGGVLALFPEGTRIRDPDALGEPRSGAGRLALETGATLVPAAISGSERLFLGPLPKPRRVRIAFGEPICVDEDVPTRETAHELVADELWPQVEREFGRLRAHRGLIGAVAAALGLGTGVAVRRGRRPPPRRIWPLGRRRPGRRRPAARPTRPLRRLRAGRRRRAGRR
ncbi:MAG TPA: lysophospholipid acyltransferase family protein [Solirubrobacteraceae bacterium]|jgi:1-acyl-sn-glycerol-3-phosphate acyltransferase|nr:lysophospholipid acyltransferase family protein [Solirubrobacteraceae bacterium]